MPEPDLVVISPDLRERIHALIYEQICDFISVLKNLQPDINYIMYNGRKIENPIYTQTQKEATA